MPMPPMPPANHASPFRSVSGHHVALRVPELDAAKTWYVKKLDFRIIHEWPFGELQLAYLAPPADDRFWIELLGGGSPRPAATHADLDGSLRQAGLHHVCLTVESVDDTLAELRRRGVNVLGAPFDLDSIGRRLAFFSDPWGNLTELAQVLPTRPA